jgi:transposase-like protein
LDVVRDGFADPFEKAALTYYWNAVFGGAAELVGGTAIVQSWQRNWEHVMPFFAYPESVRRIIYTTDEID